MIGLNHRTAPVETREKFTFSNTDLPIALNELKETKSILECVILATCNRTEIYAVLDRPHLCVHYIPAFIERWFRIPREEFSTYMYTQEQDKAVEHLFRVSCGLDSMVIGETQILGQVRDSFLLAQSLGATGTFFNMLFKQAITLAKRAHTETSIDENPVSVSYAAVELGKRIFGSYRNKRVMIIGAGKMSELTVKYLFAQGANQVFVVNRTYERAEELANKFLGIPCSFDHMRDYLPDTDIIISSTGAPGFILSPELIRQAMRKRKSRPLFIVDIAVPRDVDPRIGQLADVFLYDIDDLESIVQSHFQERQKEARVIEEMIVPEVAAFTNWTQSLGIRPVIQALQTKANLVHQETMESLLNKLPELNDREKQLIRKLTKSMLNQMLRDPILRMKELVAEKHGDEALKLCTTLFALEDLLLEEQQKQVDGVNIMDSNPNVEETPQKQVTSSQDTLHTFRRKKHVKEEVKGEVQAFAMKVSQQRLGEIRHGHTSPSV